MKRHPALVPLSRDHHLALSIARRLRRASAQEAEEARQAFLAHWNEHERMHFRLEEELLLPAYAACDGDPHDPLVARVLLDHLLIRRDAALLAGTPTPQQLHALGERLAAHVELEEHELFPLIERSLPEAALRELGERLRAQAP